MQKRWLVKTPLESTVVDEFRSTIKVDRVIGELLLKRGVDSYEKAIASKKNYAEAYANRGNVLKKQGHLIQAISDYKTAITLKPNFSNSGMP